MYQFLGKQTFQNTYQFYVQILEVVIFKFFIWEIHH